MIESGSGVIAGEQAGWRERIGDRFELTKPRLTLLSVLTTLAGYYLATTGDLQVMRLIHTLLGTFMVGGGCGALNMFVERELDGQMNRTASRPLPSGRVTPGEALLVGVLLAVGGIVYLSLAVNLLTGGVAAATFVSYVFLYTPLKRRTTLNTVVGAIPGALPPVMGWVAVREAIGFEAWVLFAILFCWQMPHFLALGWMYRRDYERAGYKMLPVVDPSGVSTSRQILIYASALLPVSLMPTLFGMAGAVYFFGAFVLGVIFLMLAIRLLLSKSNVNAKWVFHYSLIYLPLLLLIMSLDRGWM